MRFRRTPTNAAVTAAALLVLAWQPFPAVADNEAVNGVAPVDPPLSFNDARTRWRWVGVRVNTDMPCPEVPSPATGWTVRPLFEIPGDPTIPPGLAPYCLYERDPGLPTGPADFGPLLGLVGGPLSRVEPDAMAVAPYGELQDLIWTEAQDHLFGQAGKPDPLPITGSQPVRLAFVDTAASNETNPENFPGTSAHGFALVNMARALLCDATGINCLADVTAQLALAYMWPAPGCPKFSPTVNNPSCRNEVDGGVVGLLGDLAQAINREVDRWEDTAPAGQRLIINLSVGWMREFGGSESPVNMPAPVQAVLRALQDASCRGALVFAASGNDKNGPDQSAGPLYPGGWEVLGAPRPGLCNTLLGSPPDPVIFPPPPDRRSVTYGAGAVRANSEPLFNIREQGEPRMVAFADHAVVAAPADPSGQSAMLTGTSVSTAVVSAAAAAVWYYRPNVPPYEVLDFVYTSGTDLGRPAEFCLRGTPGNPCPFGALTVRRVSICAAAGAACDLGGGFCPAPGALDCPPDDPLDLSGVDFVDFEVGAETLDVGNLTEQLFDAACVDETINYAAGAVPVNPCPHLQYHGVWAEPWLDPQPGSHPCAACTTQYSSPGTFYLEIGNEIDGVLTEPVLKCSDTVYALSLQGPFLPGYKAVVSNVPCQGLSPVELSFTLNGDQSVTSPILNVD